MRNFGNLIRPDTITFMGYMHLTYHTEEPKDSGDRPALPEIEITPEMIEAGSSQLVFDTELNRGAMVYEILEAALIAAGYTLKE